jgi:SAM-dependent methyltransferase
MVDFQERITQETEPSIRVEHDVRYGAVAPLVAAAAAWVDLGCGTGLAARAAIARGRPPKVTLVDVDEVAVGEAARALGDGAAAIVADLSAAEGLCTARAAIDDGAIVTCFETVEHLPMFGPLLELLVELAERREVTVVMSVPNDAFTGVQNPHHTTVWGEGAVEELRGLLPDGYVLAHQLALAGSVLAVDEEPHSHTIDVTAAAAGAAATHLVAAFGPRAGELAGTAAVAQVDQRGQRAWERRRSADLAFYRAIKVERDELIVAKGELYALAQDHIRQLEEFRAYIHELEARLDLPLSGAGAAAAAEPGSAAAGPVA